MQTVVSLFLAMALGQAAPPATGRISGRVTVQGTNAPIAGARVTVLNMLRGASPSVPFILPTPATTDQDGRFVLNSLAVGEYRIDVQKTGFASLQDPMARPTSYTVAAGQSLDVSIELQKGAVISGKLLDQKGEPLTDARVMALRRITPPGNSNMPPRLVPAPMQGPQQTNDIGEYRVTGLAPGEYYIAATPRSFGFGGPGMPSTTGSGGGTPTTTTTFYPGTVDQAAAQAISVAAGAEVPNIVFTMQSAPAYRVSGVVVDENGAPIAHAMVMLMNDPRAGMLFLGPAGGNAQTGDDGRFSIGDVTPGAYRINASVPMTMPPGGGIVGGVSGGAIGSAGGGTFTSWSVTSNGSTTVTTTSNAPPPEPQQVVVGDADVRGVRVVTRRPPSPQ